MSNFRRGGFENYNVDKNTNVEKENKPKDISEAAKTEAVQVAKAATKEQKPKVPQMAKTIPDLTNIRKGPSIDTPVVKTVSKGAEFKVDLDKSTKEFVAVSVQGEIAFIKRELVRVYDNPAYTSNAVSKIG